MGDVSRKGDEKDKRGGSSRCDRQSCLDGKLPNGGLRNLRKKSGKIEKEKLKLGLVIYRMVFVPLNLAASRISVTMIG